MIAAEENGKYSILQEALSRLARRERCLSMVVSIKDGKSVQNKESSKSNDSCRIPEKSVVACRGFEACDSGSIPYSVAVGTLRMLTVKSKE
jgi:hypothetical protein